MIDPRRLRREFGCVEEFGDAPGGVAYEFDVTHWTARAAGEMATTTHLMTRRANGKWKFAHRVKGGRGHFSVDLTWVGVGATRPKPSVWVATCIPPPVIVCAAASVEVSRDAEVSGTVSLGGTEDLELEASPRGSMHWWPRR